MASLAHQLKFPPFSTRRIVHSNKNLENSISIHTKQKLVFRVAAVATTNAQTRERIKLKEMFEEAYERCHRDPMEGVAFTVEDFHSALEKYDFDTEIGTKVSSYYFIYLFFCAYEFVFWEILGDGLLLCGLIMSILLYIFDFLCLSICIEEILDDGVAVMWLNYVLALLFSDY